MAKRKKRKKDEISTTICDYTTGLPKGMLTSKTWKELDRKAAAYLKEHPEVDEVIGCIIVCDD